MVSFALSFAKTPQGHKYRPRNKCYRTLHILVISNAFWILARDRPQKLQKTPMQTEFFNAGAHCARILRSNFGAGIKRKCPTWW